MSKIDFYYDKIETETVVKEKIKKHYKAEDYELYKEESQKKQRDKIYKNGFKKIRD